jgi:DNA-binding MarR family transcriptional regulator
MRRRNVSIPELFTCNDVELTKRDCAEPANLLIAVPPAKTRRVKAVQLDRDQLVDRFFELRPMVSRRFETLHDKLPEGLRTVTLHQFGVLMRLRHGEMTIRELARDAGVTESAGTAVADRLVRQGLADRRHDEADRRVVRLSLSELGHSMLEEFRNAACRQNAATLSILTDVQLHALIDVFETLADTSPKSDPRVIGGEAGAGTAPPHVHSPSADGASASSLQRSS